MKTCLFAIATASTLMSSFGYSDEQPQKEKTQTNQSYHRVYVGPDVFSLKSSMLHKREFMYGFDLGYDYLRPNTVYAGIDGVFATGKSHDFKLFFLGMPVSAGSTRTYYAHSEGRLGYNFQPITKLLFTPFVGIGNYYLHETSAYHATQNLVYYAAGIRSNFSVSPSFDFGLNLKGTRTFYNNAKAHVLGLHLSRNLGNTWGYEVDLPLTWHCGASKQIDVQLEPYFLKLDTKHNQNIVGGRASVGYRF